jgi:CDP-paratose 2-epimerase
MYDLGINYLRTAISWADFHRPGGKHWYDWQMDMLSEFDVLLSIWHTPPSISEGNSHISPPRRLQDYADFIDQVINDYGDTFDYLELWNEPNNSYKWNFEAYDSDWRKFGEMVGTAAYWARHLGKPTVLGGMIPVDHHWLNLMEDYGALQYIDIVGIHAFPGMWWPVHRNWDWYDHWHGWKQKIEYISGHTGGKPVWVTETGLATWDLALNREAKYELQVKQLDEAVNAPVQRLYWYGLVDLNPELPAIEGFHEDENEYHMGLVKFDGHKKDAYYRMKEIIRERAAEPDLAKITTVN